MLEFTLAGAPVGKGRPRFVKETGRAYTPEKTVRFEDRLSIVAQEAMAGRPLFEGPLRVIVEARVAIPASKPNKWKEQARAGQIRPTTKPDWDNFGKVLDALNLVVWTDDSQIVDGRVLKFYSDQPCMVVQVDQLMHGVFG